MQQLYQFIHWFGPEQRNYMFKNTPLMCYCSNFYNYHSSSDLWKCNNTCTEDSFSSWVVPDFSAPGAIWMKRSNCFLQPSILLHLLQLCLFLHVRKSWQLTRRLFHCIKMRLTGLTFLQPQFSARALRTQQCLTDTVVWLPWYLQTDWQLVDQKKLPPAPMQHESWSNLTITKPGPDVRHRSAAAI